jgi:ribonuclease HI
MAKREPIIRGAGLFADGASAPEAKPGVAAWRANIDGGSRGNPGPASYGVVIRDPKGETVARLKKYIGRMTNNVAEYYGLIAALDYAQSQGIKALRIESDSELLVKQMRGLYKVRSPELQPLYERARKMSQAFDSFRIDHVYREQNREADALANEALDEVERADPRAELARAKSAASQARSGSAGPGSVPQSKSGSPASQAHATAASTHAGSPAVDPKSGPPAPVANIRKIRARFRGGVLYLLEDVGLPDGVEVEVILRPLPPKSA